MNLPRICFVARHNCIRVSKQAHVLYRSGYTINMIAETNNFPIYYDAVDIYNNAKQLKESIKRMEPYVDIWHVHNEPDFPAIEIRKLSKKPIVLDLHDSNYWRTNERVLPTGEKIRYIHEDMAIEMSNAIVVQSDECKAEIETRTNKKTVVVPSQNPIDWYDWGDAGFRGGLCLEGALATTTDNIEAWRDYKKLVVEMTKHKKMYIYSPTFVNRQELEIEYQRLGAITDYKKHFELISAMKNHTWSLMGNWPVKAPVWDYVHPNKLWESMAAGIPVVSFGCKAIDRLIDKYGIGITVKDPSELNDRWEENFEKRMNVHIIRDQFALDNNIQDLKSLYKELS